MKSIYKNLGKVCLTPNGYWDRQKEYERISIVTNAFTGKSYISKKDVPKGVDINNQEYWQPIGSSGYKDNNIIIISDVDENNNLIEYTLQEAIKSINFNDRRPGVILGFYGKDYSKLETTYSWFLYQFNSYTVDDWNKLSCWDSIYNNVNKFKGYFANECLLINNYPFPKVGDFAFVGEDLEKALSYICIEDGQWKNNNIPALLFANKYKAIYSKDVEDLSVVIEDSYTDRANKDALGRIIHNTYATISELRGIIEEEVRKQLSMQ